MRSLIRNAFVLMTLSTASAFAAECPGGSLTGSLSSSSSPDENLECRIIGRIFCLVELKRHDHVAKDAAITSVADTMSHLGATGSHLQSNFRAETTLAADYVYARDKMLPWTRYYYAAYSCGFNQRIVDPSVRSHLAPAWETAATECQKAHPGEGSGYPNDPLRDCLQGAMESLTKQAVSKK